MKTNKFFLGLATIAAAVFSFSSCSQDELSTAKAETPDLGQEILLSTNFSTTRSVSQNIQNVQIASGIQVGTFITTTGYTTGFVTNGNNKPFTADGSGGLTVSGDKVYYPNNANADIYAYAPYQSGWNVEDVNADQNFTVQADQSSDDSYKASDLIWATPLTNKESSTSALELAFAHKLSKINVNITNNRTGLSLKGAQIFILNTKPTAPFNLKTGALGTASGSVTEITAATLATGDTEPTATASAIIVPQALAAGTNFIKIVTDATYNNSKSTTLYAKLGAGGKTFASANQYSYTVTINQQSVELSLGGTTISAWTDNPDELEAEDAPAIGDYILKDGTFLKKEAVTDENKANIVAVIFNTTTTTLSATDVEAGFDGYAMGVATLSGKTWGGESNWSGSFGTSITTWAAALTDLDGRSKTAEILSHDTYNSFTDENKAKVLANLSDYTLAIDAGAIVGSEADGKKNLSGWFTPSIGQMIQILNNLGNAGLDSNTGYANNNTGSPGWGYKDDDSSKPQGTNVPTTDVLIAVQTKINTYVTTAGQTAFGNNIYATVTQSGDNFWQVSFQSNTGYNIGRNAAKAPSNSSTRTVIPCLAYKIQ